MRNQRARIQAWHPLVMLYSKRMQIPAGPCERDKNLPEQLHSRIAEDLIPGWGMQPTCAAWQDWMQLEM